MIVLLATLFSLVSLSSSAPSEGCGVDLEGGLKPGEHERVTVTVSDPDQGEVTRSFLIHLPANYDMSNNVKVPLVMDFHCRTCSAETQMSTAWPQVADQDPEGFLYVAMEGISDDDWGGGFATWNVSSTNGPLGPTCDTDIHDGYSNPCYASCARGDCSYLQDSCDWTHCYDDLAYTEVVLYRVLSSYCIDLDSLHFSGWSNGAMFIYSRALASLSASLASVAPVAGSPLRGYNPLPDSPVNIIDFHGYMDDTVPYSVVSPGNLGPGPDDTVTSAAGYFFLDKPTHLNNLVSGMNCQTNNTKYHTEMDGQGDWGCVIWRGCDGGKEVVHCTGYYGHYYPFWGSVEGFNIIWQFMKSHPRSGDARL